MSVRGHVFFPNNLRETHPPAVCGAQNRRPPATQATLRPIFLPSFPPLPSHHTLFLTSVLSIPFHISQGRVAILNITLRFGNRDKNKKYPTTNPSFSPTFLRQVFTSLHVQDLMQRAKKVVSDSPGLVDFAIGPVDSVVN